MTTNTDLELQVLAAVIHSADKHADADKIARAVYAAGWRFTELNLTEYRAVVAS